MSTEGIEVAVVKYADRKKLVLRYVDPITGKQRSRSAETTNRREAERAAANWQSELRESRYQKRVNLSWADFRERYEGEKLASLSDNTAKATATAFNHLETIVNPKNLNVLDAVVLSGFQASLRASGIEETSIATHLRHLRAALNWGASMGFIAQAPRIQMPKRAKGRTLMRGRPVRTEEFDCMVIAVPKVRPRDSEIWIHYLRGLWLSGLRLEESTIVSWDEDSAFSVDLSGRRPRFRIYSEAEKGNADRLLPMTPDFAEFLLDTPSKERTGNVFKLMPETDRQMTPPRVGRVISDIGKSAGILVSRAKNKFASAHDLRRAFGTRWASKIMPATLQRLMRHESIETTMKYYVDQDADHLAEELWKNHKSHDLQL